MDISSKASINVTSAPSYTPVKPSGIGGSAVVSLEPRPELISEMLQQQTTRDGDMTRDEIDKVTDDLNKITQLLNADLQFALHEETQRIMVRLVDTRDQRVLKEFPPHELLDTLAAISECIGLMLDKKA